MGRDDKDIYQRFELVVRTPKRRILLDAFLPAPGSLESSVTLKEPPPLPVPEMTPEEMNLYRPRERDEEEPAPEPKPRPKRKTAAKKKEAPPPRSIPPSIPRRVPTRRAEPKRFGL